MLVGILETILSVGLLTAAPSGPDAGVQRWSQQAYLKAAKPNYTQLFGSSVAISTDGSTAAVGAPWDSMNSGPSDDSGRRAQTGAVYVFRFEGAAWVQEAVIMMPVPQSASLFGQSVALSADGNTLVVGAPQADSPEDDEGAAYVYQRRQGVWTPDLQPLVAGNADTHDCFGQSVAISADGTRVVVGAPWEDGDADPSKPREMIWRKSSHRPSPQDTSSADTGAAYVFERSAAGWKQSSYLKAPKPRADDQFGASLAISPDGRTVAIVALTIDSVFLFEQSQSEWRPRASFVVGKGAYSALYPQGVCLTADGSFLAVGDPNAAEGAGAVLTFRKTAGRWTPSHALAPSQQVPRTFFGSSVAVTPSGSWLAVGAPGAGLVSVGGDLSGQPAGSIYVFQKAGARWSPPELVRPPNAEVGDAVGTGVSLSSKGALLVGARMESSGAGGINPVRDKSRERAGAAYVFSAPQ